MVGAVLLIRRLVLVLVVLSLLLLPLLLPLLAGLFGGGASDLSPLSPQLQQCIRPCSMRQIAALSAHNPLPLLLLLPIATAFPVRVGVVLPVARSVVVLRGRR